MSKILFTSTHKYSEITYSAGDCVDFKDREDLFFRWIKRGNLNVSDLSNDAIEELRKKHLSKDDYKSYSLKKKSPNKNSQKELAEKERLEFEALLAQEKAEKEEKEKLEKEKAEKEKLDKK